MCASTRISILMSFLPSCGHPQFNEVEYSFLSRICLLHFSCTATKSWRTGTQSINSHAYTSTLQPIALSCCIPMLLHFHDPRNNTKQPFRSILQLASLVCVALMHSQPNLHILISNIVSQRACPNSVLDKTVPCLFVFWLMRSYSVSLCLPATVFACCACFLPSSPSPPSFPPRLLGSFFGSRRCRSVRRCRLLWRWGCCRWQVFSPGWVSLPVASPPCQVVGKGAVALLVDSLTWLSFSPSGLACPSCLMLLPCGLRSL